MECKFTERSLSEYLEGELSAAQALELEEHLNECASCSLLLDEYRRIVSACRALPDYESRQELWIPIKRQIRQSEAPAAPVSRVRNAPEPMVALLGRMVFYRRVAYASIGIALLSFSVWIGQFLYQSDRGFMPDAEPAELAALEVRKAEIHYRNAIESLTQELEASKGQWNAELRQVVDQNLRTIDASIAECRLAIRKEPQNPAAPTYLLAAYRKKVELLKTLLDNQAMGS
jgi:hypothetical protein